MRQFNINTLLCTVLLALGTWNLKQTSDLIAGQAESSVRFSQVDRDIIAFRLKLNELETDLIHLRLEVAQMPHKNQ